MVAGIEPETFLAGIQITPMFIGMLLYEELFTDGVMNRLTPAIIGRRVENVYKSPEVGLKYQPLEIEVGESGFFFSEADGHSVTLSGLSSSPIAQSLELVGAISPVVPSSSRSGACPS